MKKLFGDNANPLIKDYGVAVILILAVLRLVIYPLHATVKDRKMILADQQQTFLTKSRLLEKARFTRSTDGGGNVEKERSTFYSQDWRLSSIQAEMLSAISNAAAKKGLTISGFEIPEAITVNGVGEITVVLRFSGDARSCIELLKSIRDSKKMMLVKSMEISSGAREMNFVLTISSFRTEA